MSLQAVHCLPEILDVVQDARVRALRWDVVPHAMVFDVDCALETRHRDGVGMAHVCRGWLVVENAHDLGIHIDWKEFREGFSIVDIRERAAQQSGDSRGYAFETDFPRGTLVVSGSRLVFLRSRSALEVRGLELTHEERNSLANEAELASTFSGEQGHMGR